MQPVNLVYGGGATETVLHPLVAVWMLIAILLILTLPRHMVIVVFLVVFFTIPLAQVILVGGLHFPVVRILILAGLARRAMDGRKSSEEKFPGGFNSLDQVVVLWTVSTLVVLSLQWMELRPFIKFVGDFVDSLGGYLVMRFLIPNGEAVRRTIKVLGVVCLIQGVCMLSEQFTHHNAFGFLIPGGDSITIRDGHVRASGMLGSIQGGAFGGVLVPIFVWLWSERRSRMAAVVGLVGCMTMAFASYASTSWLACGAGLLGLAFWPLRNQMRIVRWAIVATLLGLHLVMHGPVWSLIEHIDVTGGSSSYHRYMLVDNCIRHFGDWWLLGYKHYGDWGFDMWDTCNQFVAVAVTGGLVSLILYIAIFSRSLGMMGKARKQLSGNRKQQWFLWCLGSTLFAVIVSSFGINYALQLQMLLFPLLACVSVATFEARQAMFSRTEEALAQVQFASAPAVAGTQLPFCEFR